MALVGALWRAGLDAGEGVGFLTLVFPCPILVSLVPGLCGGRSRRRALEQEGERAKAPEHA